MNIFKIFTIFCLFLFFGCSSSSDNTVVTVADPTDLHTYSFWTDESIAAAEANMDIAYANSVKELERIFAIENKTYMNFIRPYMDIYATFEPFFAYSYLNDIATNSKLTAIIDKYVQTINNRDALIAKYTERRIEAAREIYKAEKLDTEQIRVLKEMGGVDDSAPLSQEKLDELSAINKQISELSLQYDRNLISSKPDNNKAVVTNMLELRHKIAVINGFSNYAEYKNKSMLDASSIANVKEVLEYNLLEISKWISAQKPNSENYGIDINVFTKYFEKWTTINSVIAYQADMYGIKIEEQQIKLWGDAARKYSVSDANGEFLGTIFIDYDFSPLKPVDVAYAAPATRRFLNKSNTLINPVVMVFLDVAADKAGEITTLSYFDIANTLMHEMGHSLNFILSESREYDVSGENSFKLDYGEYPSNLHEHLPFVSSKFLQNISRNVDNGTQISDEYLTAYMKYQRYKAALSLLERAFGGILDLEIYSGLNDYDSANNILEKLNTKYQTTFLSKFALTSFAHIFTRGYDSAYYAYVWGRLYAADSLLFMKDKSGRFGLNAQKLDNFYTKVLKPASTKEFSNLYEDFRGEGFDKDALLKLIKEESL